VIIIEAAGLAGPTLPLVLLPGLIAAGIGSLVFIGIGSLTGLSSDNYALPPLTLLDYPEPKLTDFIWMIALALVAALVIHVIIELARATRHVVAKRAFLLTPAAALLVGLIAIAFAQVSDQSSNVVLFSGQEAMSTVVKDASTLSIWTLTLLLVCKGLAWGVSMGFARGGPCLPGTRRRPPSHALTRPGGDPRHRRPRRGRARLSAEVAAGVDHPCPADHAGWARCRTPDHRGRRRCLHRYLEPDRSPESDPRGVR